MAVSKGQSPDKIREASASGLTRFGESYIQEALAKIDSLADLDIEWHFIGPIQSNKTKPIAEHFAWAHSIDREKIAKRLNDQRPEHLPPLNVCIQVNPTGEVSKAGISLDQVPSMATFIDSQPKLKLKGLMSIPPKSDQFDQQQNIFNLVQLAQINLSDIGFDVDTLSMGMSNDMEAAVSQGATILRIGTGIFGPREIITSSH